MKTKMADQAQVRFTGVRSGQRGRLGPALRAAKGRVTSFVLLAFLFSWLVEAPLALQAQGVVDLSLPYTLHYVAGYGPMAAALLLTARNEGRRGLHELMGRTARWRLPAVWWVVAFSPLLFYMLMVVAGWLLQGRPLALGALGQLKFLPELGLAAIPFWIVTFGLGEEVGWRGYVLPRLQQGRGALRATLILWFFWALWHLPLFFYTYEASALAGFLPSLLAAAIVFTWLYNSTGSILIAAVWHGMFNLTTACVACGTGPGAVAESVLVMVWAVVLVLFYSMGRRSGFPGGAR